MKKSETKGGALVKLKAPLSTWKAITIRDWQHSPYLHISDVSKCWSKGGSFDIKKSKSVTLNREDVTKFIAMIGQIQSGMDKIVENISDSDTSDTEPVSKKRPAKKQARQSKKRRLGGESDESSESDEKPRKSILKKQKRVHPYVRKPSRESMGNEKAKK